VHKLALKFNSINCVLCTFGKKKVFGPPRTQTSQTRLKLFFEVEGGPTNLTKTVIFFSHPSPQGAFFCLKTCPLILICVSAMHIHQKVPKNFLARVQVLYFFFDPLYFSFMNPKTDPKIGGRFDPKFFSRGVRIFVTALRRRKNWGLYEGVAIAIYTS